MLTGLLQRVSKLFYFSPFHPQWLANKGHLKKFKSLGTIENKKILDIGSGNSDIAKYIQPSNQLYCSDYPVVSIRYKSSPTVYLDARKLPFANGSFDCVFLFEVLEHINDFEQVLEEVERVLSKNGEAYLSVPFLYPEHDAPFDFQRFSRYGLNNYLDKYSLEIIDDVKMGAAIETVFMLFNLYLLMLLVEFEKRIGIFVAIFVPPVAALCLLLNLLAFIFNLALPDVQQLYLGRFIRARKR